MLEVRFPGSSEVRFSNKGDGHPCGRVPVGLDKSVHGMRGW